MDAELHRRLIGIAGDVSPELRAHIAAAPIWFPYREDTGVTAFLARAVTGQQVSAAAARSIWARVEAAAGAELPAFLCERNTAAL
ncbi:MAG TPA: hypothetical protein VNG52_06120, partial [Stellaceae bacterium]|nr:hypothetical protein [Stellaceae bacterium]